MLSPQGGYGKPHGNNSYGEILKGHFFLTPSPPGFTLTP
ncbi:hypothetical protein DGo_CA2720 [Deinococcus gobiensis I-0]|uniref:Uncharacterized protein n=1 Tax=Deinococcus gobiensis (strain DSM 21396 / JCM 16679 / CGMCC 1.7299 / I-0) TaxID=745776 RepID=H8GUG4_DEIGI|nr:hypothetical protein DGo_CA2720 [Deinococcus gobiensis I-0]